MRGFSYQLTKLALLLCFVSFSCLWVDGIHTFYRCIVKRWITCKTFTPADRMFYANLHWTDQLNIWPNKSFFIFQCCRHSRCSRHLPAGSRQDASPKLPCLPSDPRIEDLRAARHAESYKRRPPTPRAAPKIQLNHLATSATAGNWHGTHFMTHISHLRPRRPLSFLLLCSVPEVTDKNVAQKFHWQNSPENECKLKLTFARF